MTHPKARTLVPLVVALAVLTAACGGRPTRPIGIQEFNGDISYSDQAAPPPPTIPPSAELMPTFPGFITPPAPRSLDTFVDAPATTTTTGRRTGPAPVTVACPDADPLAVPENEAFGFVSAPPKPQTLPFRLAGSTTVNGVEFPYGSMFPESQRRVGESTRFGDTTFRFNVDVVLGNTTTTTTYQVDQRGAGNAADGISIVQIRTSDQVATDAFTPSAPIRILPLPPVAGQRFSSVGTDPLHSTAITIFGQVKGKGRVNACGIPLEGWLVEIGRDPQTQQPSSIRSETRNVELSGTYVVGTQFGGIVLDDRVKLDGTERGNRVIQNALATVNRRPALP